MRALIILLVSVLALSPLASAGGLSLDVAGTGIGIASPAAGAAGLVALPDLAPAAPLADAVASSPREAHAVATKVFVQVAGSVPAVMDDSPRDTFTEDPSPAREARDEPPPPAPLIVRVAPSSSFAGVLASMATTLIKDAEALVAGAARAADDALGGDAPGSGPSVATRAQGVAVGAANAARSEAVAGAVLALVGVSVVALASTSPQHWSALASRFRRFGVLALAPLYTRLTPGDALSSEVRGRIFALIQARPGVTLAGLANATGSSRTAVSHHVRVLERDALVTTRREGRVRLFFENGRARVIEARAVAVLDHETTRAVARAVAESPGLDQSAVCRAFALRPSLAHWHLSKLESVDLIEKSRDGRRVRYAPGPSYAGAQALGIV